MLPIFFPIPLLYDSPPSPSLPCPPPLSLSLLSPLFSLCCLDMSRYWKDTVCFLKFSPLEAVVLTLCCCTHYTLEVRLSGTDFALSFCSIISSFLSFLANKNSLPLCCHSSQRMLLFNYAGFIPWGFQHWCTVFVCILTGSRPHKTLRTPWRDAVHWRVHHDLLNLLSCQLGSIRLSIVARLVMVN